MTAEARELRLFLAKIESIGLPEWGIGAGASDKSFKRIKRMLSEHGQIMPIVVRDAQEPDDPAIVYEIIDGEKRLAAAADLGWQEIYVCHVPNVDEMKAREFGIALFGARGEADREALADTLSDLQAAHSGDAEEIARLGRALPFHSRNLHKMIGRLRGTNRAPDVERRKSRVLYRFKVPPEAADVIDRAVDRIVVDNGATRDQALEYLAAEFMAGSSGLTGEAADRVREAAQRLRDKGVEVAPKTIGGGNDAAPPETTATPPATGGNGTDGVLANLGLDVPITVEGKSVEEVHAQLVEACPSMKRSREIFAHVSNGVATKSRDRKAILKRVAKTLVDGGV
jgi:ParB-like chromosome segregation protein Spo0J